MTIAINLLPWRQEQRLRQTQYMTFYFQLSLAVGCLFGIGFWLHADMKAQDARKAIIYLKQEIQIADVKIAEIKKYKILQEALISRMKVVHTLQSSRILTVHLFDELADIILDGIYLISVQRVGDRILVHGYAESNTYVSQLMRNIEKSQWIQEPVLTEIKRDKKPEDKTSMPGGNEFQLSFTVKSKQLEGLHHAAF